MNTIQRILPLALLTLVGVGVVSCDDPMAERERFIQQTAAQRNNGGVHTTSQRFTFTKWIMKSKGSFLLPTKRQARIPSGLRRAMTAIASSHKVWIATPLSP